MKHIPQFVIDQARDELRFGANPHDIAGKLGIGTEYLIQLLRTDRRPKRDTRTTSCGA